MTITNTENLIKKISNKLIGFLESLDENQKSELIFDFSDDERYIGTIQRMYKMVF